VTAHRHRRRHCCLALLSVLLLAHPSAAPAEKLVAAWSSVSAVNSPLWIMHDAGFFKQEGLDVDLIFVLSSPTVAKATLAGEVAVSGANSQVIVDSGLAGADLIAMGSMSNVVAFYIMAGPEIRSVADLKGKTVGITRFGSSSDFGMRMLLAKHGLEPNKDVAFVQIGGMPEIAAAISKKLIAAAPMSRSSPVSAALVPAHPSMPTEKNNPGTPSDSASKRAMTAPRVVSSSPL